MRRCYIWKNILQIFKKQSLWKGELIDSSIAYGARQHKILRKVVTDYIDNNFSSKFFYKGLFYRTIRSAAPDYWDMGGTSYYRVFLTESKLKLYCLDNFFRLV